MITTEQMLFVRAYDRVIVAAAYWVRQNHPDVWSALLDEARESVAPAPRSAEHEP